MRQIHEFRRTIAELQSRERETLSLYDPLPQQLAFHRSTARERIFVAANQVGKQLKFNEPVLTPEGWVEIGKLKVGDKVLSGTGEECSVSGVFPQGVKPVYKLVCRVAPDNQFSERVSYCGDEHLWYVWTDDCGAVKDDFSTWPVLTTAQLKSSRYWGARIPFFGRNGNGKVYSVPLQSVSYVEDAECVCISVDHPTQSYITRDYLITHNTTGAIIEVALALTGRHPRLPAKNGRCFLVAKDGKEIGEVLYRKLCRPGLFKIIYDKELGRWRPYKWWIDGENNPNVQDAPPLLPRRYIKSISWDKKAAHVPEVINCTTGWEARFFTSLGSPPHGVQLDLCHMDEECVNPDWYSEVMARLIAKRGLFMWSATPQKATHRLLQLYERAKEEAEKPEGERGIEAFFMELHDNPYLTDRQKQEFINSIGGDEQEYLVRVKGQFAILGYRVFPEFERREDAMTHFDLSTIPNHWTRYAITDPGRQVCAVLFAAVPPPDEGDFVYLYDELYMRNCTADQYGAKMKEKSEGQVFYDFIIDHQGARVRDAGQGRSIESQYSEALSRYKVSCKLNGVGFSHGVPDVRAGVEAIRELIRVREDGTTKLRYFKDRMPNFDWEMKHWHYKRNPDGTLKDDPEDRGRVHLAACIRYLALYRPKYQRPEMGGQYLGVSYERYLDKMRKRRALMGTPRLNLGPGGRTVSL